MSTYLPILESWEAKGYKWQYIHEARIKPFAIPGGGEVEIPYDNYKYLGSEILLLNFAVSFDSIGCGVRFWGEPRYDSKRVFTVANLMFSSARATPIMYATVPPDCPFGTFFIYLGSPRKFEEFLQISVFNTNTSPHYFLGAGYELAVLKSKRVGRWDEKVKPEANR